MAAESVRRAADIVRAHELRPANRHGRPGGLIDLSADAREVVVIGDLHGAHDNLKSILAHEGVESRVKAGKAVLVFLGDGPHNDQTGQMREMASSLAVMDEVVRLVLEHRSSVVYIRGNHDTFEDRLAKSGILQGVEMRKHALRERGQPYVDALEDFFESLPALVIGRGYVISHAGPVRNGCTRQEIVDLEDNPDYQHQLRWNRVHELRGGTPSLKEYDGSDVLKMRQKLGVPEDAYFIVGHNPLWQTGNLTGIWKDAVGIKNHIILYTNLATRGPYLLIRDGAIEERFAVPVTKTVVNYARR